MDEAFLRRYGSKICFSTNKIFQGFGENLLGVGLLAKKDYTVS